jgi:hypothetical protein
LGLISKSIDGLGTAGRWAYRAASQEGRLYGLSEADCAELWKRADILVNLTASTVLRDEQLSVPVRIYLETDPVLPQIEIAKGRQTTIDLLSSHTHHFTYGENFGEPDCGVPISHFTYQPTRPPVILEWWKPVAGNAKAYTTIANWRQSGKDIEWNGEIYSWSKHTEFLKFLDLPGRTGLHFELALASIGAEERQRLHERGWHTLDGLALSRDVSNYRDFIVSSRAEFTVAKDQNIRLRSGWFSDRSACYLAAGRPVITQETGFSKFYANGKGLFGFKTMEDILAALDAIESDYEGNCRAARDIAEAHFAAKVVLPLLLKTLSRGPDTQRGANAAKAEY